MNEERVLIIGGGMAGITCAKYLSDRGIGYNLVEKSDRLGGKLRTEMHGGFRLDAGFQVFLTNYDEPKKILNYGRLKLAHFDPGAVLRIGRFNFPIGDPRKNPSMLLPTIAAPIGSISDKLKTLKLAKELLASEDFDYKNTQSTLDFLKSYGFSNKIIDRFYRPFFEGIFLENKLDTSSSFFKFVFKQLAKGTASIPERGMEAIPMQIEEMLDPKRIFKNKAVKGVSGSRVYFEDGDVAEPQKIIIATEAETAARFFGLKHTSPENGTICSYFAAESSPTRANKIILNTAKGLISNIVPLTNILPLSAPKNQHLIAVNSLFSKNIDERTHVTNLKRELVNWYGPKANVWRHLKTYVLPGALPAYRGGTMQKELQLSENLYRCGDHLAYPSLNAAMATGRLVAGMID